MRVTQISDRTTHAVIGGDESIEMGMSDSAEFFSILYKSLYSDQILAVVRETLCNGWDAHIEAGQTDKPLDVTLTDEELIIRDYGNGIRREMIGPIYGVMGGSTKVANGNVTGGFGLGCKAPYAYVEHFEVTSWSKEDGEMTIYRMMKADPEKKNKPSITPIVSVPTIDHGLQVKIQIKASDRRRFDMLIRRIAHNGEIKVRLNGAADILPMMPFGEAKHGFLMTQAQVLDTDAKIHIRYGNVIYPLERMAQYGDQYNHVTNMLDRLGRWDHWKIIFQARPNTIAITPSRETLSMQEGTIAEVTRLLNEFKSISNANLEKGCCELLNESIKKSAKEKKLIDIFDPKEKIPGLSAVMLGKTFLVDFPQFVRQYASRYPTFPNFRKKDLLARLQALIDIGYGDRGLIQTYRSELIKGWKRKGYQSPWFHRQVIYPLKKALHDHEELAEDKLYIFGDGKDAKGYSQSDMLVPIKRFEHYGILSCLPFLRNVVILTHNRQSVLDRASQFPIMKETLGTTENCLVYLVARSVKKVNAARSFFEAKGYTLIDLTKIHPWEAQHLSEPVKVAKAAKPKRMGLPILSQIMDKHGAISTVIAQSSDAQVIGSPEFVIKIAAKNDLAALPDLTFDTSKWVIKNWGDKGGIVVNVNQEEKYISAGSKSFHDYMMQKILDQFQNNQRIKESLPFDYNKIPDLIARRRYGGEQDEKILFDALYSDKDLREYFGFVWTLTDEDKMYLKLWGEFKMHPWRTSELYRQVLEIEKAIKLDDSIHEMYNTLLNSRMVDLLSPNRVRDMMLRPQTTGATKKQQLQCRDMLLEAIEG